MPHQSKRPFKRSFNLGVVQAVALNELGLTIEQARQSKHASYYVADRVLIEAIRQNFLWEKMTSSVSKKRDFLDVALRKKKGALYDYVYVERQNGAFLTPLPCAEIEISKHRAKAILQAILTTPEIRLPIPSEVRIGLGIEPSRNLGKSAARSRCRNSYTRGGAKNLTGTCSSIRHKTD